MVSEKNPDILLGVESVRYWILSRQVHILKGVGYDLRRYRDYFRCNSGGQPDSGLC